MRHRTKQILSLFLCLLLILGQSSFAVEEKRLKKEEVIYSKLNFSGDNELLIAVNGFPKGFRGLDYGDYQDVTNLSNPEEIQYKHGKVSINAKENFYYQGRLKTKELPWLLSMKWTLDGKEVTEDELLGKSGLLGLHYEVKKNPKVSHDYYERYVLQTSFNFKVDQVGAIRAPEGTLAVSGSSKLVNYMTLPGKGGSYFLEAEVTKYEPGMVQIAALPLNFPLDSFDFSEYTGDLKTLEMAIAQISGGTGGLVDGLGQVHSGLSAFTEGGDELVKGSGKIDDGLDELKKGSGEIQTGLGDYSDGMKDFGKGIRLLTQGLGELEDALPLLLKGSQELKSGVNTYLGGVKQLSGGIGESYAGMGQIKEGVEELGKGLKQLVIAGKGDGTASEEPNNLVDASAQFLKAFEFLKLFENFELTGDQAELILHTLEFIRDTLIPAITAIDQNTLVEIIGALEQAHADLGNVITNLKYTRDQLQNPAEYQVEEGEDAEFAAKVGSHYKEQMNARANELTAEIIKLELIDASLVLQKEASSLFHEYFGTLETSFNQFKNFLEELQTLLEAMELDKDKILGLNEQLKKLTRGYEQFHEGLVKYVDGVEQVYEGVAGSGVGGKPTLLEGVSLLYDGLGKLDQGGKDLSAGGDELSAGVTQLADGIKELVDGLSAFGEKKGELEEGFNRLEEGASLLYTNYKRFHDGLLELSAGMGEFNQGLGQYVHGFWQLSDGLRQLYEGGLMLDGGAKRLASETSDMDEKMLSKIKDVMKEFSSENYDPKSFLDERNKDIKSVHFVMLYEGKTIPVEENVEEEAEPTTFWDKLLNIFK